MKGRFEGRGKERATEMEGGDKRGVRGRGGAVGVAPLLLRGRFLLGRRVTLWPFHLWVVSGDHPPLTRLRAPNNVLARPGDGVRA